MADIRNSCEICESELKRLGINKYAFSAAEAEKREFNVDGGEFSLFRTLFDNAVSVTVFENGRKGVAQANKTDGETVRRTVADAHAAAQAAAPDDAWDIAPKHDFSPVTDGAPDCDTELLFSRTKEFVSDIKERYPKIMIEQLIVSHDRSHRIYRNSNGTEYECTAGEYGVSVMFSAHDGEEATSFFGSGASCASLDKPFIELGSINSDLRDVENQLYPKALEGKFTGTMVLTPSSLGTFVDSIVDNFASDGVILNQTSIWKDKLGEKVADSRISIRVDPRDPSVVCGERLTAEGFPAEGYDFIKDGVLENFALSLYVANKVGGRRAPCSSFPCIIKAGDKSIKDIISGIDRGILVGRFSGGDPGTSGDFSGVAKNSFYIENGKIAYPLSEVMISGNLAQLLVNLTDISSETVEDGGSSMPYMAFGGVTISGK